MVSEILDRSVDDFVLGQETKLHKHSAHKVAGNTARRCGWGHCIGMAHQTFGTMGSGGCAVLARQGIGLATAPPKTIPDFCSHRISLAWAAGVTKEGIHLMSIYLICSVGMNAANKLICECAAVAIRAIKGPWVIGGDWNMTPETLAASGFLRLVNGMICAPEAPTCG